MMRLNIFSVYKFTSLFFLIILSIFSCNIRAQIILHEVFNDISQLPASGWVEINRSSPAGSSGYFQGLPSVFSSYSGAPSSYIAVNYNSVAGSGTISNWKITPQITLKTGDVVKFRTRTAAGSQFPDRLQLRLNILGTTNVGTTSTSVGNFTVLLVDVNPTLTVGGFPETWTEYSATVSGLPNLTICRLAFRYFVTNGGPSGVNSNYVGIDEFVVFRPVTSFACANGVGCQVPDQATAYYSSTNSGFTISEQFVPLTPGPITEVCWFGAYFNPTLGIDCSPGPGDNFFITYYFDDNGEPGDTLAGPFQVNPVKSFTGNLLLGFINEYGYGVTHSPVQVISNQPYWLSIRNNIVTGDCRWGWVTSGQGDGIHFLNGSVQQNDDLAFCLNVPIKPDGGLSAAPVNDVCAQAIEIHCDTIIAGTTINATIQQPPGQCNTDPAVSPGVWYKFTGNGKKIIVSTCNTLTDFDTRLTVYSGLCDNLNCIDGNDNAGIQICSHNPSLSEVVFCSSSGVEYFIYVTGTQGSFGNFKLSLQCLQSSAPSIISCLPDISVSADHGMCSAYVNIQQLLPGINYISECNTFITNSFSQTNDASGFFPVGTTLVTWKISDGLNQFDSCIQTVTVFDNQNPFINCPTHITVAADPDTCIASSVMLGSPVVSDNCSVFSVSSNAPIVFEKGLTNVLWTVVDINNNLSTCTQIVEVTDNQLPVIICPPDVVISADSGVCFSSQVTLGLPFTSDNCFVADLINDAPALFYTGFTNVSWRVFDQDNNMSVCIQQIVVTDDEYPVIVCPSDTILVTDPGQCSVASVLFQFSVVSDNCMITNVSNNAVFPLPSGMNQIIWSVVDAGNNVSSCIHEVHVIDTELPVIICPADLIVETDQGTNHATNVSLGTPFVTDNCGVDSVFSDAHEPYLLGTTAVEWTVSDFDGNKATCIQNITVTPSVGFVLHGKNEAENLHIMPNPNSGIVKINFSLREKTEVSLVITDVTGKLIAELIRNVYFEPGNYNEYVSSETNILLPGVYFIILTRNDQKVVRKMLVN